MRFGVDATGWVNRRGYGRFARNAVARLVELDDANEYVLYVDAQSAPEAALPPRAHARVVELRARPTEAASATSTRPVADVLRLGAAVRKDRLDAFLFPSLQTYYPVFGTPTVVGLHDAIPEELPRLTLANRRARLIWTAKQRVAITRASRLFTVSEASRRALELRLGLAADRVALVPEAPDPVFSPRGAEAVQAARTAVGLASNEPFVLYAGGISPHKDVETLIEAFAVVRQGRLVVVGDLESETYVSAASSVRERIATLRLEDDVILPGFVSDEHLAALYTGAAAVVVPSLAEGFGLPAVEAAACGAPLVLSDLPAHRESMDGAALFFPPGDREQLVERLRLVLAEPGDLGEQARAAVRRLTWSAAGERLAELLAAAARPSLGAG